MKNHIEQCNLFTEKGYNHGGARAGSGRKKTENPRKAHSISCTDSEFELIKQYLEKLRNELI